MKALTATASKETGDYYIINQSDSVVGSLKKVDNGYDLYVFDWNIPVNKIAHFPTVLDALNSLEWHEDQLQVIQ